MKDLVHTFFGWKPLCYWLGFTTFALGSLPTLAAPSSPGVGKEWVIVFEDDFDGDTIDVTKWVVRNESRGNGNNGVSWRWDTSNVSLSNGYLVIRTTHNNTTDVYSSGGIATEGIFQQRYGYF